MNFKWLWVTYKQLNIQEDFATWVIRDGLVNKELYCRKDEIYEYHIPKEVNQKLLTNNYKRDMMIIQIEEEITMTHEKYNELQTKMDKLASDFVDEMAEIEKNGGKMTSEWLDTRMEEIYTWADTYDGEVLAELRYDYLTLKEMLEC